MEQRQLGRSGISVSQVILGCGNFGGVGSAPAFFGQGISRDEAFRIMDAAWELGIRTFDTADAYGGGRSETWIGEWLAAKGSAVRDALAIETKTFNPVREGADRGLSRARILQQLETSLERLGLERVDLYVAHEFDPDVPQEETLRAFDELVRSGKVGAIGASNFSAEQLAEAVELSELEGLARYEWAQRSYSLLDRSDEETVFPVLREHGLGYEAYGPLAGGWLTGKYRRDQEIPSDSRAERFKAFGGPVARRFDMSRDANRRKLDLVEELALIADKAGISMTHMANAFALAHPAVTSAIIGPRTMDQLTDALEGADVVLGAETLDAIDDLVAPGTTIEAADRGWEPPWMEPEARRR